MTLVLCNQLDDGSQPQARQEQFQRLQADLSGKTEQLTIQTRRLWEADEQSQRKCASACTVARLHSGRVPACWGAVQQPSVCHTLAGPWGIQLCKQ